MGVSSSCCSFLLFRVVATYVQRRRWHHNAPMHNYQLPWPWEGEGKSSPPFSLIDDGELVVVALSFSNDGGDNGFVDVVVAPCVIIQLRLTNHCYKKRKRVWCPHPPFWMLGPPPIFFSLLHLLGTQAPLGVQILKECYKIKIKKSMKIHHFSGLGKLLQINKAPLNCKNLNKIQTS